MYTNYVASYITCERNPASECRCTKKNSVSVLFTYSLQKVIGFDNWTTVVTAVLVAAPTGYVMCAQNSSTQGTPKACYLVDIYANRTSKEASKVVSVVQEEIYKFLNPMSTPSS